MKKYILIWALIDNRTGNRNQILGILNELKLPYKIHEIHYNFLAILPNFIIQILGGRYHVKAFNKYILPPYPSLILSCGRRTFPIATYIKKKITPNPLLVHLMYPKFSLYIKSSDLIFTPQHDNIRSQSNLVTTIGTPNQIKFLLKRNRNNKSDLEKPIISILIGGNHGRYKLKKNHVNYIINTVVEKIKNKGSIIISTSRRTSNEVISLIDSFSKNSNLIKLLYHPNLDKKKNTIFDVLSPADEIIVTGDSMSMVSEACSFNKPVRIYFNERICSPKHLTLCKNLINKGYAFPFESLLKKCNVTKTLDTTRLISKYIMNLLKNGKN